MPTVLTPQGWVKTAPAPRKRKPASYDPKAALRGPLAYLACQPSPPALNVGKGTPKGKAPFPYDLSASPDKLKRQGEIAGSRTVSAPIMSGALHHDDDVVSEPEDEIVRPSKSDRKSKSRSSRRDHHDDNHSVASSSSSSSSSSRSSAPSSRSYTRHRPPPPVEARPHPTPPAPAPRNHYYSTPAPRYDQYMAPPPVQMPTHMPMPMPPSSGRSMSYSWYNATTPLNLA
jgi:hypothetical protein